ncbi:hypothetical protein FACS189483_03430 [Spirochaetia bacterium]|nr:hypothetical protein FACS189483_03430 [Spirochaetia bacterium]
MKTDVLYQNLQRLPAVLQQEVSDFVGFLLTKYSVQDMSLKPRAGCMKAPSP